VGPTASGKTALALELAGRLGAEIVSADSRQVYRGLDIGTAKPTAAERAAVPHHCLDLVAPGEPFDAARFRAAATAAIADVHRRGRPVLIVGGTGLWVRALLRGLCPAPPRVPRLRRALEAKVAAEGAPALHRWLDALDPPAAARIHAHDGRRIVRAVEVALATGVPLSRQQAAHAFGEAPHEALVIGLARPAAELAARIATRAQAMVAAGFLEEVRALGAAGVAPGASGLDAVGYREMLACVEGRTDLATALAATVQATRRFAKRQRTWFRGEPGIVWYDPERDRGRIAAEVEAFLAGCGDRPCGGAEPPPRRWGRGGSTVEEGQRHVEEGRRHRVRGYHEAGTRTRVL
jgi:tRNA dimethylallyltransferase